MNTVTARDLKLSLDTHEDITVLDVQTEEGFIAEHVPDAVNIPVGQLEEYASELLDADGKVVVYAKDIFEALEGANMLERLGYTHVSMLEGGLQEWISRDYDIQSIV